MNVEKQEWRFYCPALHGMHAYTNTHVFVETYVYAYVYVYVWLLA